MKTLMLALLAVSAPAFAGSLPGSQLSFDEIREACQDPARFQNQIAPTNLQVTCEERTTKWLAVPSTAVDLPTSREIISSLSSDKYTVAPTSQLLDSQPQRASCPRYKEVLEHINFTKATSCDEIVNYKGSETDFCSEIVDKVRENNPKGIERSETGNTRDLCEVPADSGRDQRDQRDQRGQRGQRGQR
jgi:hypothetical protein